MSKNATFVAKVDRNKSVRIPRNVRELLELIPGDMVQIDIEVKDRSGVRTMEERTNIRDGQS